MVNNEKKETGIGTAVRLAGSQAELAGKLGVSQQAVSLWLRRGYVPLLRAQEIEALYGIARCQLINPRIKDLVDLEAAA